MQIDLYRLSPIKEQRSDRGNKSGFLVAFAPDDSAYPSNGN
ncbi:MAG: hypothetical protein AB1813_22520 [Verrucomicrobiota bacterium]